MAKKAAKEPTPPSPYEIFGTRIQKIISSPKAQKDKMAVLERLEGDNPEFWERLLEEISENDRRWNFGAHPCSESAAGGKL